MSHGKSRILFTAALADWCDINGIDYSVDNVYHESVEDENHIRSHLIPADTYSDTLGGDIITYIGMFQMSIYTKFGTGLLDNEIIIEALRNVFKLNRRFTDADGFSVQVTSPIHAPEGKQIGGQWVVPCYFDYRADTN